MKDKISQITKTVNTLDDLAQAIVSLFIDLHSQGPIHIGYVSGLITSEGPANIPKNLTRLERFTTDIRRKTDFPVFSPTDVFNDDLFRRIDATGAKNTDYEVFWNQVLGSGHVTHMFMTPRWEISHGSVLEHQIAQHQKMQIIYLTEEI